MSYQARCSKEQDFIRSKAKRRHEVAGHGLLTLLAFLDFFERNDELTMLGTKRRVQHTVRYSVFCSCCFSVSSTARVLWKHRKLVDKYKWPPRVTTVTFPRPLESAKGTKHN